MKTILYIKFIFLLLTIIVIRSKNANAQKDAFVRIDKKTLFYQKSIENNKAIVQFIEFVLTQHNIPKALRNLALIESNFNKNALSRANAAGVWQFVPSTAVHYGLQVTAHTDQRYDIYKSTFAAVKNLTDLYNEYQDWKLVVAAYNCGKGNINKAFLKAGSSRYEDIYRYLPHETINHVNKFLLACYATNELDAVVVVPSVATEENERINPVDVHLNIDEPVTGTEVTCGINLEIIAQELDISLKKLQQLNPDINEQLAKSGTAKLILPIEKMPDFLLQKTQILNQSLK